ncbi:hypothetical protein ES708_02369 [subsurface metagenome]
MDINFKGTIHTVSDDPYKIELIRGQKGTYAWTITCRGPRGDLVLSDIESLDNDLRRDYLPQVAPPEEA